jgi:zinc protease
MQESLERWQAVSRDDVIRLHRDFVGGQSGEVAVVGDFEPAEILPLLGELTAGWTARQPYVRIPRPGDQQLSHERTAIETPDKPNAVYFAAAVTPMSDAAADYPAVNLGNFILGASGLSSRLGDRVRQGEGLSYGVGSFLRASSLDDRSVFYMYAITNAVNMPKVETAIREEFERLLQDGVQTQELSEAQTAYLENQKVARADDAQLTQILASTLETGRTMEFYSRQEEAIRQLTVEQVKAALNQRLSWGRIVVSVAGDFANADPSATVDQPAAETGGGSGR